MTWVLLFWFACCASALGGWLLCVLMTAGKLRRKEARIRWLEAELSRIEDECVGDGMGPQLFGR